MRYLKPILLAAVLALPAQLAAQRERPELVIRVVDQTTGAAIPAARVAVSGNRRTALTGDSGLVRIAGLEPRKHFVTVERLGYTAERFVADMAPGGVLAVDVELAAAPVELRGVRGRAARQRPALRNVGFYERARQGFATIVDKEKIEGRKPANMLDLFRGLRGFRVALSGRSGEPRLFSSRGPLSLGKTNDSCSPAVFLDGSPFPSTEINLVPPESVEAIEAYPGIAGVPLRFSPNPSPCGSVFIWTRTGG